MKYIKYIIPVLIIFLTIGFAATNVTLSITGDAYIASDLEDFEVYISSIKLDGVEDITLLKSSTEFVYTTNGGNGTTNIIEFAITNASTKFDADVNIECSDVDETLTITKTFDSSTYLSSMSSRSGTVKIYADGVTQNTANLTCTINATPIERTEYGEGEVPDKLIHNLKSNYLDSDASGSVTIVDEVVFNDEKFYIAYFSNDEVELIAQYNIGVNFRQSSETNYVTIMDDTSVLFTSGGAKNYSLLNKTLNNHNTNISSYMKTSIKTLLQFLPFIKNTFLHNYHNGFIEGNNNFIKVIKRIAFGFRSFRRFKARIMICKGLLKIKKIANA